MLYVITANTEIFRYTQYECKQIESHNLDAFLKTIQHKCIKIFFSGSSTANNKAQNACLLPDTHTHAFSIHVISFPVQISQIDTCMP